MKDIKKIIETTVNSGGRNYVTEAVSQILGEDITVGQEVAVIDDVISGMTGAKGRVKSISDANPGFATVSLASGAEFPMQTSLLVPI
jgi:hypothetical protein